MIISYTFALYPIQILKFIYSLISLCIMCMPFCMSESSHHLSKFILPFSITIVFSSTQSPLASFPAHRHKCISYKAFLDLPIVFKCIYMTVVFSSTQSHASFPCAQSHMNLFLKYFRIFPLSFNVYSFVFYYYCIFIYSIPYIIPPPKDSH